MNQYFSGKHTHFWREVWNTKDGVDYLSGVVCDCGASMQFPEMVRLINFLSGSRLRKAVEAEIYDWGIGEMK